MGVEGLEWALQVQIEVGLNVITEVANPEMVENVLRAELSAVWIGARTTVNPFAVQEIAEALRGTGLPVLVKNPVNPDVNLWLGALERVERLVAGPVAACHRGFSHYGPHRYRNLPLWEVPLELRRLSPALAVFCDPSHIAGRRERVPEVAQKALDLGFTGLMVEVHPAPEQALSDAAQQLAPEAFASLVQQLKTRPAQTDDPAFNQELHQLRLQIDDVDLRLLDLLNKRLRLARCIGALKNEADVRPFQLERWLEVFATRGEWARDLGFSPEFTERFLQLLHVEMLRQQETNVPG
jgi:chorismate mutase